MVSYFFIHLIFSCFLQQPLLSLLPTLLDIISADVARLCVRGSTGIQSLVYTLTWIFENHTEILFTRLTTALSKGTTFDLDTLYTSIFHAMSKLADLLSNLVHEGWRAHLHNCNPNSETEAEIQPVSISDKNISDNDCNQESPKGVLRIATRLLRWLQVQIICYNSTCS